MVNSHSTELASPYVQLTSVPPFDPIAGLEDSAPLDWQELFTADLDAVNWELEPICEKGQLVALVAPAKTGKSLLVLEWCARLAKSGRRVLYLDFENTTRDIVRRLKDMGYGPSDLGNMVYLSFPVLGPLDTESGAQNLAVLTATHRPDVLIIDTWSRVIKGKENDSDPVKEAYRLSLLPLKSSGITVFRLDHTGKDISRGSRGTSAKNDDVDHEWTLTKKSESHFLLERTHTRTGIGQDKIDLRRTTGPLRHEFLFPGEALSIDVQLVIRKLDELEIPANTGRTKIAERLKEVGYSVRTSVLAEAVRHRKEQMSPVPRCGNR